MIKGIKKAVFPIGGLGTRFLPATKAMPKEMLPIVDKPLIQYAVEEAKSAGIEEIIFVTGRGKASIEDHFDRSYELEDTLTRRGYKDLCAGIAFSDCKISYTRQGEPLGLGHAILCARPLVGNEPFAVLLADDIFKGSSPCMKQLVDIYEKVGGNVITVMDVPRDHTSRYGIVTPGSDVDNLIEIKDLIEKPEPDKAPSLLAISGRYILQPEIFNYLETSKADSGGEIQLTDSLKCLIGKQDFYGHRYDGQRFDCGDKLGWLEANIAFALERDQLSSGLKKILETYLAIDNERKK